MKDRRGFNFKNQIPIIIGLITIAGFLIGAGSTFSESLNKIESNTMNNRTVIQRVDLIEKRLNENDIRAAELKKDIQYIKEGIDEIKEGLK